MQNNAVDNLSGILNNSNQEQFQSKSMRCKQKASTNHLSVDRDFNNFMKQIDGDELSGAERAGGHTDANHTEDENKSQGINDVPGNLDDSESDGEPFNVQATVKQALKRIKEDVPMPPYRI